MIIFRREPFSPVLSDRGGLVPVIPFIALLFLLSTPADADVEVERRTSFEGARLYHQVGSGFAGTCTLTQYNICSGFVFVWNGFSAGDEVGVVYDLPALCAKDEGENCTNNAVWVYWRNTLPGRGFTVTYDMYEADGSGCKVGSSLGSYSHDPVEEWNQLPGLGTTTVDKVAIIATFSGTLPAAITDNNERNLAAGAGGECSDAVVGASTSYQFADNASPNCPPSVFSDSLGPVDLLLKASFTCAAGSAQETRSWGGVKALFR